MEKRDGRKLSSSEQELLRKIAVEMVFEQGFSKLQAALALGVSRQNVALWCRRYSEGGAEALRLGRRGRRPQEQAKLKGWQCGVITTLIRDNTPDQLKLPFVLWSAAAVRDLVFRRFAITLPIRTMRKYLAQWNFTPQKPVRKAWAQCPAEVSLWLEETYPHIVLRAKKNKATIYWVDETGITNHANSQRGYAPRGKTPELKQSGTRYKINMISGITNRGEVRFMCYTSTMTQSKFILFLSKLMKSTDGPLVVITDNLRVHHGKRVIQWVEEQEDSLSLEFIPKYSPELNPDEYLNRDLKNNVNAKRSPRTADGLKENVMSFMHGIQKQPTRTQMYFNGKHIAYAA
jgi:transposase